MIKNLPKICHFIDGFFISPFEQEAGFSLHFNRWFGILHSKFSGFGIIEKNRSFD